VSLGEFKSVSRRHLTLQCSASVGGAPTVLTAKDEVSKFGTFVNEQRVTSDPLVLNHGDVVRLGASHECVLL